MRTVNSSSDTPQQTAWALLFAAWLIAAVSTLGALFLSHVMGVVPCVLCWYQRVFMFPLVFVLGAGLFSPGAGSGPMPFPLWPWVG